MGPRGRGRYGAGVPLPPSPITEPQPPPVDAPGPAAGPRGVRGWVGALLAGALLVAVCVFALRGLNSAALADHVARGGVTLPALIGTLVGLNLLTTAWLVGSVTACFGPRPMVSSGQMLRLIAASQLLNYLPALRAGLVGRAAYLKKYHGLRLRDSGYVLVLTLGLTASTLAVASVGPLLVAALDADPRWAWAGSALGLVVLTLAVTAATRRLPGVGRRSWFWVPLRTLDLAAVTGRTALAFAAVGQPLTLGQATLLASTATLVRLTGLTPNGLGLSEWVVAGLAAALAPVDAALAAAAALLERGIEVAMSVVAGLWALMGLRRAHGEPRGVA